MANIRVIQSPYIGPFSNIETVIENASSTQTGVGIHVGELGGRVELTQTGVGTKEYQKVQMDSGAVAAAGGGVPTLGQLVYWKDKSKYLVTNDSVQAVGGQSANNAFRNEVAGMIVTPTASFVPFLGQSLYIWIQQKGNTASLKSKSVTAVAGYFLVSDTTTAQADIVVSTGAPIVQTIGKNNTVGAAQTTLNADLDIPGIP
jgi:hypothetical protein